MGTPVRQFLEQPVRARSRRAYGHSVQRVLWITLFLNVAVALAKLVVGLASNSLALLGDAAHSVIDAANNIIGIIAVGAAAKDADEGHPYGHSKIETLAAFVLAGFLFVVCFQLVAEAVRRLAGLGAATPSAALSSFVVVAVTLVANIFVARYEARWARRLGSEFLYADAAHTRTDVLITSTVLASLLLVRSGWPRVDALLSLLIAFFIGRIGFKVFQRTVPILVDASAVQEGQVRRVVEQVPGVVDAHAIRSRRAGGVIFIDLHIVVDAQSNTAASHALTEDVEAALTEAFGVTSVTIHVESSRHCGF